MNAPELASVSETPSWAAHNRDGLLARFAQLRQRIGACGGIEPAPPPVHRPLGFEPALHRLVSLFGLSRFEADVLLLCAGMELDQDFRAAVAARCGVSAAAARVSFELAFDVLDDAHWDAMSPSSPLRFWRLLSIEAGSTLARAAIRVDERVLHYLTGVPATDERLLGVARYVSPSGAPQPDPEFVQRVSAALDHDVARPPLVVIDGDPAILTRAAWMLAAALAQRGIAVLALRAQDLGADARELAECARLVDREAALTAAVALIQLDGTTDHASEHERRVASLAAWLRGAVILLGRPSREMLSSLPQRRVHRVSLPPLAEAAADFDTPAVRAALQQFTLDRPQVETALVGTTDRDDRDGVWQALREAARGGLDALAQRIESRTRFDDLVLPPGQLAALRAIARQLRHRDQVYNQWGFARMSSRGLGLCVLFAGESGTGKTMAAEAIANEAKLDLYRIDLATVVSKYIGETEKNLKRVFDAAEASAAVLLFDEADAVFGKRSEVKDSHDRYANIEIAYLLQRIEAYRGLAILTTNMKSAIDRAFLRRIRFVVQFPFPDDMAREVLWRSQFPSGAPRAADIDWRALARMQLSGGHIRAVALNAAFLAAAESSAIGQHHLLEAARAEYLKLERPLT